MILVYHNVSIKSKDENTVSIFVFILQMLRIKFSNLRVVTMREYFENSNKDNLIVLTFDDGFRGVLKYAYPVLRFLNFQFELFICEKFVKLADEGEKHFLNSKELKFLVRNGAVLQYHTKLHLRLTDLVDEELEKEIVCSDELKALDVNGFEFIAYPYWVYDDRVKNIVEKYYKGAISGNGHADDSLYALDSIKVLNRRILECRKLV